MTSPEVRSNGQKKTGSLMLCKSKRRALGLMAYTELVVNKPRASSVAVISHHTPGQEGSKGPVRCWSNKGYQPEIQPRLADSLGENWQYAVQKYLAFYENRKFITVFIKARHCSLSWGRWIQFTPAHLTRLRSPLILPVRLQLGLSIFRFLQGLYVTLLYAFIVSPVRVAYLFWSP